MDLEHVRRELVNLPPDEAARLLRELLDRVPAAAPDPSRWDQATDEVLVRYREALERLAK